MNTFSDSLQSWLPIMFGLPNPIVVVFLKLCPVVDFLQPWLNTGVNPHQLADFESISDEPSASGAIIGS